MEDFVQNFNIFQYLLQTEKENSIDGSEQSYSRMSTISSLLFNSFMLIFFICSADRCWLLSIDDHETLLLLHACQRLDDLGKSTEPLEQASGSPTHSYVRLGLRETVLGSKMSEASAGWYQYSLVHGWRWWSMEPSFHWIEISTEALPQNMPTLLFFLGSYILWWKRQEALAQRIRQQLWKNLFVSVLPTHLSLNSWRYIITAESIPRSK